MKEGQNGRQEQGVSISKIDAAASQLDWSIILFLDHQAYVPAITLAGAAEGILGENLGNQSSHHVLKTSLSGQYGVEEKEVSDNHLNRVKNWFKHGGAPLDEGMVINLENEAIQLIARALSNFLKYDRSLPSQGPRFIGWRLTNRPDLSSDAGS